MNLINKVKYLYNEEFQTLNKGIEKTRDGKTSHVLGSAQLTLGKWLYNQRQPGRFQNQCNPHNDSTAVFTKVEEQSENPNESSKGPG